MYGYKAKLVDSSRYLADILSTEIGNSPEKFNELMSVAYSDEYPLSMRAARIAYMCGAKYPALLSPHIPYMIKVLNALKTEGVKRGFLKALSETPLKIEDKYAGLLADIAFETGNDPNQSIAVRSYALDLLMKLCDQFPDLAIELTMLMQNLQINESRALSAKRRKLLLKLGFKDLY